MWRQLPAGCLSQLPAVAGRKPAITCAAHSCKRRGWAAREGWTQEGRASGTELGSECESRRPRSQLLMTLKRLLAIQCYLGSEEEGRVCREWVGKSLVAFDGQLRCFRMEGFSDEAPKEAECSREAQHATQRQTDSTCLPKEFVQSNIHLFDCCTARVTDGKGAAHSRRALCTALLILSHCIRSLQWAFRDLRERPYIMTCPVPLLPPLPAAHPSASCSLCRSAEVATCLAEVGPARRVAAQRRLHDPGRPISADSTKH